MIIKQGSYHFHKSLYKLPILGRLTPDPLTDPPTKKIQEILMTRRDRHDYKKVTSLFLDRLFFFSRSEFESLSSDYIEA